MLVCCMEICCCLLHFVCLCDDALFLQGAQYDLGVGCAEIVESLTHQKLESSCSRANLETALQGMKLAWNKWCGCSRGSQT